MLNFTQVLGNMSDVAPEGRTVLFVSHNSRLFTLTGRNHRQKIRKKVTWLYEPDSPGSGLLPFG